MSLIYMNMANKNQTGLFPKVSQDMTGNSHDSAQNLQLLKWYCDQIFPPDFLGVSQRIP